MSKIIQSNDPNGIDRLDTLKIKTVSGNLSPQIFANGRNQTPVEITIKALNKKSEPLQFTKEIWSQVISLTFAESNAKLNFKGNISWCYTDEENDYSNEILVYSLSQLKSSDDGTTIIIMYIYTNDVGTKRIAVSIDTNDKHFTTADISSGAEKMSVTIKGIQSINYGDRRNLTIVNGDFVSISNDLGWTSRLTTEGPYKEHYNGTCKRRTVRIQPNISTTGQTRFKKHEIIYNGITNNDVNSGTISWIYGVGQPSEDCFSLLQVNAGYPCAVIGRGAGRADYQINLWYSRQNSIHIDGQVYLVDGSYYYRFCPYVKENHFGDDEEGFATLLLYKFTMPENNTRQWKWHDEIHEVTVKVTDIYGNEGVIKLTFDDTENFDTPGIA